MEGALVREGVVVVFLFLPVTYDPPHPLSGRSFVVEGERFISPVKGAGFRKNAPSLTARDLKLTIPDSVFEIPSISHIQVTG